MIEVGLEEVLEIGRVRFRKDHFFQTNHTVFVRLQCRAVDLRCVQNLTGEELRIGRSLVARKGQLETDQVC